MVFPCTIYYRYIIHILLYHTIYIYSHTVSLDALYCKHFVSIWNKQHHTLERHYMRSNILKRRTSKSWYSSIASNIIRFFNIHDSYDTSSTSKKFPTAKDAGKILPVPTNNRHPSHSFRQTDQAQSS